MENNIIENNTTIIGKNSLEKHLKYESIYSFAYPTRSRSIHDG